MKIYNIQDLKGKSWDEVVNERLNMLDLNEPSKELYKPVYISDELFKEVTGQSPNAYLLDEWDSVGRCPKCGEYMFTRMTKQVSASKIVDGEEEVVADFETTSKLKCRCGVEIYRGE